MPTTFHPVVFVPFAAGGVGDHPERVSPSGWMRYRAPPQTKTDYAHKPINIMANPKPNTCGLSSMAAYKGVKPIKITLDPEMIDYAKSKGNASAFINNLLKESEKREDFKLDTEGLNELGEAREIIKELRQKLLEADAENYRLWQKLRQ